jgi:regulator of replication initiation timing
LALDNAQYKLEHLNSQFSILKAENNALLEDKQRLSQENDEMKMKLSSVNELRKAIRELKLKPRIIEGNKGYLIKDGQPTVTPKVKIEVVPAQGNK